MGGQWIYDEMEQAVVNDGCLSKDGELEDTTMRLHGRDDACFGGPKLACVHVDGCMGTAQDGCEEPLLGLCLLTVKN
jgi:hypothetical protein